ncbi:unnamed protein product [Chrysoparadoxa australica]
MFHQLWALCAGCCGGCFAKPKEHPVVMVGLDGAGKTTILYKLALEKLVQTLPTIGFNAEQVTFHNITIVLWDLGGQARLRQLWGSFITDVECLVFVMDASDKDRLTEAKSELHKLLLNPEITTCKRVLLLANKQDQEGAATANEVAEVMGLSVDGVGGTQSPEAMAERLPGEGVGETTAVRNDLHAALDGKRYHIQECCALSGQGLEEGLRWMLLD